MELMGRNFLAGIGDFLGGGFAFGHGWLRGRGFAHRLIVKGMGLELLLFLRCGLGWIEMEALLQLCIEVLEFRITQSSAEGKVNISRGDGSNGDIGISLRSHRESWQF